MKGDQAFLFQLEQRGPDGDARNADRLGQRLLPQPLPRRKGTGRDRLADYGIHHLADRLVTAGQVVDDRGEPLVGAEVAAFLWRHSPSYPPTRNCRQWMHYTAETRPQCSAARRRVGVPDPTRGPGSTARPAG